MITPNDVWSQTVLHEGITDYLYLDTVGIPTVGVGFACPRECDLLNLKWEPCVAEAVADHRRLLTLPKEVHPAVYYRRHTRARMSQEAIRETFESKALLLIRRLDSGNWSLSLRPEPVQRVLFDLVWSLGAGGLAKFVKLKAALDAKDWAEAAKQTVVTQHSASRNEWRSSQLLGLV